MNESSDHTQSLALLDNPTNGAMFAVAEVVSESQAKLKKPRPMVGLPKEPERTYDIRDMAACGGSILAAHMLYDIRFWKSQPKFENQPVSRSIAEWGVRFKCSKQNVRTAIKHLRASGQVQITEDWFNGSKSTHYFYTGAKSRTRVVSNTGCVKTNTGCVSSSTTITDINSDAMAESKSKTNSAQASPDATTAYPEVVQEKSGKTKPENKYTPPPVEAAPDSEKPKPTEPAHLPEKFLDGKKKLNSSAVLWMECVNTPGDSDPLVLDAEHANMLKQVATKFSKSQIYLNEIIRNLFDGNYGKFLWKITTDFGEDVRFTPKNGLYMLKLFVMHHHVAYSLMPAEWRAIHDPLCKAALDAELAAYEQPKGLTPDATEPVTTPTTEPAPVEDTPAPKKALEVPMGEAEKAAKRAESLAMLQAAKNAKPQATDAPAMTMPEHVPMADTPTEPEAVSEPEPEAPAEIPKAAEIPAPIEIFDERADAAAAMGGMPLTLEQKCSGAADWRLQQAEKSAAMAAAEAVEKAKKATKTGKPPVPKPHHLFDAYD
ncbi:hypothetical protein [Paraburkholderia gardini]|uniref:Helix-turn-helix protein n=1 Tax=Paraburkholderia gardini TaxID=2823469 RepID=A0ABN7QQP0_9BURK|nr:hypothetical protein [Paraburkholderia gardini]CAG4920294.1 hypothetical protein R54767_04699 [Paraburkholderia gardini]